MSELKDVWDAKQQGTWKKCPLYDIYITGCTRGFECEIACGIPKSPKNAPEKKKKRGRSKHTGVEKTTHKTPRKTIKTRKSMLKMHVLGGSKHVRRN